MKKKTKILLILLAVLIALTAAYFIISAATREDEEEGEITLFSCNAEDIEKIDYSFGGEDISLERSEDGWKYKADESFPLDDAVADKMAEALSEVKADRTIGQQTDLEQYGLNDPKAKVTVALKDGEKISFSIGGENSLSYSSYLMVEGDKNVYVTSADIATQFDYPLLRLGKRGELPEGAENGSAKSLEIALDDGKVFELSTPVTIATYYEGYTWQAKTPNGEMVADQNAVNNILGELQSLDLTNLAAYNVDEKQLLKMGFDDAIKVDFKYEYPAQPDDEESEMKQGEMKLELLETDDGYYAHLAGDTNVYSIPSYSVNYLAEISTDALMTPDVCIVDYDSVKSMKITFDGEEHELVFSDKDASLDGKKLAKVYSEGFFEDVISLENEGLAEKDGGKELLRIDFDCDRSDEFSEMTLVICEYDPAFAKASFAGRDVLINLRDVDMLKESFEEMAKQAK